MERFLYLIKRKMSGEVSVQEEEELARQLEKDVVLAKIYSTLFLPNEKPLPANSTNAELAYLKHSAHMKQLGYFSKEEHEK